MSQGVIESVAVALANNPGAGWLAALVALTPSVVALIRVRQWTGAQAMKRLEDRLDRRQREMLDRLEEEIADLRKRIRGLEDSLMTANELARAWYHYAHDMKRHALTARSAAERYAPAGTPFACEQLTLPLFAAAVRGRRAAGYDDPSERED